MRNLFSRCEVRTKNPGILQRYYFGEYFYSTPNVLPPQIFSESFFIHFTSNSSTSFYSSSIINTPFLSINNLSPEPNTYISPLSAICSVIITIRIPGTNKLSFTKRTYLILIPAFLLLSPAAVAKHKLILLRKAGWDHGFATPYIIIFFVWLFGLGVLGSWIK
jgi:hypothetical protein